MQQCSISEGSLGEDRHMKNLPHILFYLIPDCIVLSIIVGFSVVSTVVPPEKQNSNIQK